MIFTIDRFEVLSTRDIDPGWITDPKFLDKPFTGPMLLFANMPADPVAYQKLLREIMFEGKPDIQCGFLACEYTGTDGSFLRLTPAWMRNLRIHIRIKTIFRRN